MNSSCKTAVAAAVAGGYVLGRTRKAKTALAIATFLAGRKFGLSPAGLASEGLRQLRENPRFEALRDQISGELMAAARSAASSSAERGFGALADSLRQRGSGRARDEDEEPEEEETDEAEEPEEEEEEEEPEEPAEEEAEEGGRSRRRSSRRGRTDWDRLNRPAKKAAARAKAPAKKTPAKRAPSKRAAAKKTAAKKAAPARKKAAAGKKTAASRRGR